MSCFRNVYIFLLENMTRMLIKSFSIETPFNIHTFCDLYVVGMFELTDPAGLPSGRISVTLRWKFTYLPPTSSAITTQQTKITGRTTPERQTSQDREKTQTETQLMAKDPPIIPQPTVSEVMPCPRPNASILADCLKVS